jgi:hypothetical protein
MPWPWVHRARLDAAESDADRWHRAYDRAQLVVDRAVTALDRERERADRLMAEIIRMRREGYVPQPEPQEVESEELPGPIEDAIVSRAFNPAMERHLRRFAAAQLRSGQTEAMVAQAVLDGESFEEPTLESEDVA